MRTKARVVALLMAVLMVAALLPMSAVAAEGETVTTKSGSISISNVLYQTTVNTGFVDEPGAESGNLAKERIVYWVSDIDGTVISFLDGIDGERVGFDGYAIEDGELIEEGGVYTVATNTTDGGLYAITIKLDENERTHAEFYEEDGAYFISFRDEFFSIGFVKSESTSELPASTAEAPSSWAAASVNAAIDAGIVPTALQSKYTTATTRAEFCALAVALYETLCGTITERAKFDDTTDVNVEKMAALGVVNGTGEGKFSPSSQLTREQAATMLARLADEMGSPLTTAAATFADNSAVSSWASAAVGQVQAAGIMGGVGDNNFSPKGSYTREQSILTILRLYDLAV